MYEENTSNRQANLAFFLLLSINIFFLTSHLGGYVSVLKRFFSYLFFPVPSVAHEIIETSIGLNVTIGEITRVHQENLFLKEKLKDYALLNDELNNLRIENERLYSSLNFKPQHQFNKIAAKVMFRESGSWFEWVAVDKGLSDGVTPESPVIAVIGNTPVAVGRVWEAHANESKIVLLTNVLSSVPVQLLRTKEDALLDGGNTHLLDLNYILAESDVKEGDEVVVSPISDVFPAGTHIGYVSSVKESKNSPFKSAEVKLGYNLNTLREVIILINTKETTNINKGK